MNGRRITDTSAERKLIIAYKGHKREDIGKHTRCIGRISLLAG